MTLSRKQARDLRTGRAWSVRAAARSANADPSPATTYADLTRDLAALRAALATDRPGGTALAETRHSHANLDRALAQAVAFAFAADAQGAPTPAGIASWAGEGVARSTERELAIFATIDACGSAPPPAQVRR